MSNSNENRLVWGAAAIAAEIGLTTKAAYHQLERGRIPGARKVGGRWCFRPDIFARAFAEAEAA